MARIKRINPASLNISTCGALLLCCLTWSGLITAQEAPEWIDGDYGPVISTAMDVGPKPLQDTIEIKDTQNYVFRGRLIRMAGDGSVNLCFDTEHMRVAGAWHGGYVRWQGPFKNMGPTPDGQFLFQTVPGPGWSYEGKWADPREVPEGPLPRGWAKYRGLYLHGDRVVLSYSVGDCPVLEMPTSARLDSTTVVSRHLTLGPCEHSLGILLCEQPNWPGELVKLPDGSGTLARLTGGGQCLVASVSGAPAGTKWEFADGRPLSPSGDRHVRGTRLHLLLPPLAETTSLRIDLVKIVGEPSATEDGFGWKGLREQPVQDLRPLTKGGPRKWTATITTTGQPAKDETALVVEPIGLPLSNPYHATMRLGGLDFFRDGRAALCTWEGDVWIVSGLDQGLTDVRWQRFATGLHQPLGLKIIDDQVYTAGRDQVTRLHDLNGDGEADWYENLNNDAGLTLQRHEFVMDLQADAQGNLYYCRSGHYTTSRREENCCVVKLAPDGVRGLSEAVGTSFQVFARGLREPNGMSIGPDGVMTVGDNEGNGIPATPLYELKENGFYGFTPEHHPRRPPGWQPAEPPIVMLPKEADNSAGGQIWVTSDNWGPLRGGLLHTSYGACALLLIMTERVDGVLQGSAVRFPLTFTSGIMRGRFHPRDGQLYLCGLRGWGGGGVADGQFCRVRYTGLPLDVPIAARTTDMGMQITFDRPLDVDSATDDQNWGGDRQDLYRVPGRTFVQPEEIFIDTVQISEDHKSVSLQFEQHVPATNLTLIYDIRAADGTRLKGTIYATVHRTR